jgi:hypothetical protein
MPIKSFRGLIANGDQQTIALSTNNGSVGYKIVKFEIMTNEPGNAQQELIVKIYKIPQSTVPTASAKIDFSDNTLLAAGMFIQSTTEYMHTQTTIFDNEIFNQDIYVTHTDNDGSDPVNYYIELEQMKLALDENTVATLKDIRNITQRNE